LQEIIQGEPAGLAFLFDGGPLHTHHSNEPIILTVVKIIGAGANKKFAYLAQRFDVRLVRT